MYPHLNVIEEQRAAEPVCKGIAWQELMSAAKQDPVCGYDQFLPEKVTVREVCCWLGLITGWVKTLHTQPWTTAVSLSSSLILPSILIMFMTE